jgi:hypothetical protein
MVFHVCAICGVEEGLSDLTVVESLRDRICLSGIEEKFHEMFMIEGGRPPNQCEQNWHDCINTELEAGLLKGATHVCHECVKGLPTDVPRKPNSKAPSKKSVCILP